MTYFYTKNENTSGSDYRFYGVRETVEDELDLIIYLQHKGYITDSVKKITNRNKAIYMMMPKTLDTIIGDTVKDFNINDLTTAQYAFYEGHITFKQYNQIVKDLKERSN